MVSSCTLLWFGALVLQKQKLMRKRRVCLCVCVCFPDIVGCVLQLRETTTEQSGWAPVGVKAALNGSTSRVCSAGSTRSRKETVEEQSAVHNVALNTTSSSPRWVWETLHFCGFAEENMKTNNDQMSDWRLIIVLKLKPELKRLIHSSVLKLTSSLNCLLLS